MDKIYHILIYLFPGPTPPNPTQPNKTRPVQFGKQKRELGKKRNEGSLPLRRPHGTEARRRRRIASRQRENARTSSLFQPLPCSLRLPVFSLKPRPAVECRSLFLRHARIAAVAFAPLLRVRYVTFFDFGARKYYNLAESFPALITVFR